MIGVTFVALAVGVGMYFSPVIGGVIAAAPLRFGISLFLGGWNEGSEFAKEMVRGALPTYVSTIFFFVALWYTIPRYTFLNSFIISTVFWTILTIVLLYLTGSLK